MSTSDHHAPINRHREKTHGSPRVVMHPTKRTIFKCVYVSVRACVCVRTVYDVLKNRTAMCGVCRCSARRSEIGSHRYLGPFRSERCVAHTHTRHKRFMVIRTRIPYTQRRVRMIRLDTLMIICECVYACASPGWWRSSSTAYFRNTRPSPGHNFGLTGRSTRLIQIRVHNVERLLVHRFAGHLVRVCARTVLLLLCVCVC